MWDVRFILVINLLSVKSKAMAYEYVEVIDVKC